MGKAHGKKRRQRKKFNYTANRKKLWKKSKKMPVIECSQIKEAWSNAKSICRNMAMMGLVADPNVAQRVPSTKEVIMQKPIEKNERRMSPKRRAPKGFVAKELEEEASIPYIGKGQLPSEHIYFAKYMIERHGDDYKAMSRDSKNIFQQTPAQIKRKVIEYKNYLDRCET